MSMSDGKIPVFEHPPIGKTSLDDCLGWVAEHWRKSEAWISKIASDPDREPHWDDAVKVWMT